MDSQALPAPRSRRLRTGRHAAPPTCLQVSLSAIAGHAYAAAQERVADQWSDAAGWTRKAVLNVARMGKFSSYRTIREYAREIWRLAPVPPEAAPR